MEYYIQKTADANEKASLMDISRQTSAEARIAVLKAQLRVNNQPEKVYGK